MSDLILATLIFIIIVIMSISTIEEKGKEKTLYEVQDTLVVDTLKQNYYETN